MPSDDGLGIGAVAMVKGFSVVAALALVVGGCAMDTKPYIWPTPVYGVPFTQTSFTIRYSGLWNTEDEIRDVIAHYCGPGFDVARVSPGDTGATAAHPDTLSVWCGPSPQPKPEFRGHEVNPSYLISLRPSPAKPLDAGDGAVAAP